MKRLAIPVGLVAAFLSMTAVVFATEDRFTVIHITKNHRKTTDFPGECRATVTTETLPSKQGDQLTWLIRNGNAENIKDVCKVTDKSSVELRFQDFIFGTAAGKNIKAVQIMHNGNMVWAVQGIVDGGLAKGVYKYQVWHNGVAVGPDPEVEVDCASCGGGGGQ
jgi:hypothetical protein